MSTAPSDTPNDSEQEALEPKRSRSIGKILIDLQRLSVGDVSRIHAYAKERGLKFGDAAIELDLLTQHDVNVALGRQFFFPVLSNDSGGALVSSDLVTAHRPHSAAAESLRTLRSRLSLGWQQQNSRRILAITSPDRGDGRSWLAANLALAFSHVGDRTLLIDADFRSPRQAVLFNLQQSAGLTEFVTGRADGGAIHRVHPNLRLFVLPAGEPPPNPQELLARPFFEAFLNQLAEQFDVVILDTPPANLCSDAQLLAARAGSCLVLSRLGHTQQSHLGEMIDSFEQTGTNVVGGVLNDFEDPKSRPSFRHPWRS